MTDQREIEEERPADKPAWVRPTLERLGNMKDKILGSGKAGSNLDQDPEGTFKSGVG